ncbi:putative oxidoreductase [Pseudoxanthomonas sp. GM95]|uniref:DoxX family protein n=1 Tax=Pseudoxanthomonas sp. GM95 TaxID=1881043 RepID=UPI0008C15DB0|nr:DoxX family protein [Pseudoxanthomonas sp. GM95]SEM47918.1 putative oxidoreductase [Pseudoxanthomonas sp. GM95]
MQPTSVRLHASALSFLARIDWLGPLLVRLVFGYFWAETGWAKLHNLDFFTARFVEWGIPLPAFSAALCAGTEFIGGVLILIGLATRLTMIPMLINMLVALIVVVLPGISTLDEFVELDEVLYVTLFVWLLIAGPGRASVDHLIARAWRGGTPLPGTALPTR